MNFHGKDTLKFGISNNCWRRMREYNNSETSGFLKEVKDLFKCSDPKRLELILKYYLPQYIKSVAKMEYFDVEHYDFIKDNAKSLACQFGYSLEALDYHTEYEKQLDRSIKK